jgi:hypothetical protein
VTFQAWVAELIEQRYGTATALAEKVGMKLSPFTRGVKAGKLNLVNLLKLASVTGTPPSTVLRLAGKGREAAVIEEVYGPEKTVTDPALHDLFTQWPTFSTADKDAVRSSVSLILRGLRVDAGEKKADERRPARKRGSGR